MRLEVASRTLTLYRARSEADFGAAYLFLFFLRAPLWVKPWLRQAVRSGQQI